MYAGYYEEGDTCPECHEGKLDWVRDGSCSCHISAPCSNCVNKELECEKCGWRPENEPEYRDIPVTPDYNGFFLAQREYKPKPLDNSKIDYRIKMHTASTQICEGVYPEGTSMEDIRKVVRGTFGGRFEEFGGGKFKYIAYTD